MASTEATYRELYRPQLHFSPANNFINDPNGLVYFDGEYHAFYQHNPYGNVWGHMSWGHAVSTDLIHWQHLPVAIPEENGIMAFSGSAVIDNRNTSGFGTDDSIPIVAVYTGFNTATKIQDQRVRYSLDRGRTFIEYSGNPVLNRDSQDFRDPKVFWYSPTSDWRMVVVLAVEHKVQIYRSPDLKSWTLVSEFGPAGATAGDWECPDLFKLPVIGGVGEKWVLKVDITAGTPAGGSAGQYFIGQFDGKQFVSDDPSGTIRWLEHGSDFYASQSWNNLPATDGRIIWMAWLNNWIYANAIPTAPWRGSMTIPRQVTLRQKNNQILLCQNPIDELQQIRNESLASYRNVSIDKVNAFLNRDGVKGQTLELLVNVASVRSVTEFGFRVLSDGTSETKIGYNVQEEVLYINRTKSGRTDFSKAFPAVHRTPLKLEGNEMTLRIFVDWSSLEVFVYDGQVVMSERVFPNQSQNQLQMFYSAESSEQSCLVDLDIFRLNSIW